MAKMQGTGGSIAKGFKGAMVGKQSDTGNEVGVGTPVKKLQLAARPSAMATLAKGMQKTKGDPNKMGKTMDKTPAPTTGKALKSPIYTPNMVKSNNVNNGPNRMETAMVGKFVTSKK